MKYTALAALMQLVLAGTGDKAVTTTKKATTTKASTPTPSPACVHDKCATGTVLKSSCDPCVSKIIAQDSYCGSTAWDSTCVDEVDSICGITCGATTTSSTTKQSSKTTTTS
ncbi:hypothetical protein HDV03_001985, partial [Kappamyces sp. JEL0829]